MLPVRIRRLAIKTLGAAGLEHDLEDCRLFRTILLRSNKWSIIELISDGAPTATINCP